MFVRYSREEKTLKPTGSSFDWHWTMRVKNRGKISILCFLLLSLVFIYLFIFDRNNFVFKTKQPEFVSKGSKILSFIFANIFLKTEWKLVACMLCSVALLKNQAGSPLNNCLEARKFRQLCIN